MERSRVGGGGGAGQGGRNRSKAGHDCRVKDAAGKRGRRCDGEGGEEGAAGGAEWVKCGEKDGGGDESGADESGDDGKSTAQRHALQKHKKADRQRDVTVQRRCMSAEERCGCDGRGHVHLRVDVLEADTQGVKQSCRYWLPMQEGTGRKVEQAGGNAVVPGQGAA